ncbi:MAG: trypsin-like peptidase domain-containing protein [Nitrososphaerota archaeon]
MPLTGVEEAVSKAVEKVYPSVVSISTVRILHDYLLNQFPVAGMGSGVLVSEDGYIVTNYHVVGAAEAAQVILSDGRRFEAIPVGGDPASDIAVVRVRAANLKKAELGDSDKLKVGQIAVAVGSPFGFILGGPTVTMGVVSALKRRISAGNVVLDDLIQTDASINPGNSGGPLVNTDGQVIAINTAIIPYAQGIGFAIPVNTVKKVVEQIMRYGRVVRPKLGIHGLSITPSIADYYGLPVDSGVLVVRVEPGSAAGDAGIDESDIITHFDGEPVEDVERLRAMVEGRTAGQRAVLTVVRGTRVAEVAVNF